MPIDTKNVELTPEIKQALDSYIENREKRIFVASASTIVAVVAIVGGVFTYIIEDARSKAEIEAIKQFDIININMNNTTMSTHSEQCTHMKVTKIITQ